MASVNPSIAVQKLSEILKIATIDIECVGCKEVYPDFMTQLISRISTSVSTFYSNESKQKQVSRSSHPSDMFGRSQDRNGQLVGVSWNQMREMQLATTAKSKRKGDCYRWVGSEGKSHMKDGRWLSVHTPQTERFQYNMAKTNEIDLAVEKKSQMMSDRKEIFLTPHGEVGNNVELNELSSGGKYVYGKSGSKWNRGENFQDVVRMDFYQGSESKLITIYLKL